MVLLPFLLAFIGMSVDMSRVATQKGRLQTVSDLAVIIAVQEARDWKSRGKIATKFAKANLGDMTLKTRTVMVGGEITFQMMTEVETPLLGMIGRPQQNIFSSTAMPRGTYNSDGQFVSATYSRKQLRAIRRNLDKLVKAAPEKHRQQYRREYDQYYERLVAQSDR